MKKFTHKIMLLFMFQSAILCLSGISTLVNDIAVAATTVVAIVIILTEYKKANGKKIADQLKRSVEENEQTIKILKEENAHKTLLIRYFAHETRINLTPIKIEPLMLQMRQRLSEASSPDIVDEFNTLIKIQSAAVNNLFIITTNLLQEFEREMGINSVRSFPVKMKDIASEITLLYNTISSLEQKSVELYIPESFPTCIQTDEPKVRSIINNLLSNALKYTDPDGTVVFILDHLDETMEISVVDQGKGMSQEQLDRLFEPFATEISPKNLSGIGLGMYITKHLVNVFGGWIKVTSELDKGTSFLVRLPIKKC